jgi:hypothetical protein
MVFIANEGWWFKNVGVIYMVDERMIDGWMMLKWFIMLDGMKNWWMINWWVRWGDFTDDEERIIAEEGDSWWDSIYWWVMKEKYNPWWGLMMVNSQWDVFCNVHDGWKKKIDG